MTAEQIMIQQAVVPSRKPNAIAIFGVCRSGTTAMLIAFAKAGYHTYYQPFKHSLWTDNHTIIWIIRDPFHTWRSWEKKFSCTSFNLFQEAYRKQLDTLYFLQKHEMSFSIIDFSNSSGREQSVFKTIASSAHIPISSEFYDWKNAEETISVSQPVREPQPFLKSFQGDDSSGNPVLSISQRDLFVFPQEEKNELNSTEWNELYKIYTELQQYSI